MCHFGTFSFISNWVLLLMSSKFGICEEFASAEKFIDFPMKYFNRQTWKSNVIFNLCVKYTFAQAFFVPFFVAFFWEKCSKKRSIRMKMQQKKSDWTPLNSWFITFFFKYFHKSFLNHNKNIMERPFSVSITQKNSLNLHFVAFQLNISPFSLDEEDKWFEETAF